MKRVLLFFSSFVIVTVFSALIYFLVSGNHAVLREALRSGDDHRRQLAVASALAFEQEHLRAVFGDKDAQYKVGRYFTTGEMGPDNQKKSIFWLTKAADKGQPAAALALARFSFMGQGMEKDEAKGAALVQKAAEDGSSRAQGLMGILYLGGIGVEQNFDLARTWLDRSREEEAKQLADGLRAFDAALSALPPEEKAKALQSNYAAAMQDIGKAFIQMLEEQGLREEG